MADSKGSNRPKFGRLQHKGFRKKTLIYIAIKNLVYKRLRTLLTATGVVIGIGAIVFLVSFALGLRNTVSEKIVGSETVKTIDVTSPDSNTIHLNNENLSKFSKYSHVTDVSKTYIIPGRISLSNSTTDTVTYGADTAYLSLVSPKLVAGTLDINSQDSAVVNLTLLKALGKEEKKAIGQKIKVSANLKDIGLANVVISKTVTIKGVIDSGNGTELYTGSDFIKKATNADYAQAKLVVDNQNNVKSVRAQIESLGFVTQSPIDTLDQINRLFSIFAFILAGFGGIGMIIAILGMFNTLTISLLERTSEIGLMMAIGARRRDVKRLFMAEALSLSLAGGVGGVIGAWILGTAINIILTNMAHSRGLAGNITLFSIPLSLVGLAIAFILFIGYLVVLMPARRAARINPIDALRHE